jgi:hypothetical protein
MARLLPILNKYAQAQWTFSRPHLARDDSQRWLDIPTGRQTYRAFKVKLIISVINDEKTKNVITFNQYFLFKHILN